MSDLVSDISSSLDAFAGANIQQIRDSVNEATQELCMLTGTYRRTVLVPLYAGRMFYRLDLERDHFGWVVEAWDRDRRWRLTQTSARQLYERDRDFLSRDGNPDCYFPVGHDILGIWRRPAADGTVLELTCAMIPKQYTSGTDPVRLRHVYETAASFLATSEFYASRGDAGRATEYLLRYLEMANLMGLHPQRPEAVNQLGGGANGGNR